MLLPALLRPSPLSTTTLSNSVKLASAVTFSNVLQFSKQELPIIAVFAGKVNVLPGNVQFVKHSSLKRISAEEPYSKRSLLIDEPLNEAFKFTEPVTFEKSILVKEVQSPNASVSIVKFVVIGAINFLIPVPLKASASMLV